MSAVPWLWVSASQVTSAPQPRTDGPTFTADVAPILRTKCLPCHRQDGDAPVPLETINQVRRRASLIVQVTASGYMPPWKPANDSPAYLGERRLTERDKATLKQWVTGGMPEGEASKSADTSVANTSNWTWGPPDLVLALPDYILPAGSNDVFRNFVVSVPFAGSRTVRGFQFRPRSRAVHHANIRLDSTSGSAELDLNDPAPGYEGVILHSAQYPPGHFLGWTPGQAAAPSDELGWRLDGGTHFVVQLHMRSTGQADHISPLLGLYFTEALPVRQPTMLRLGRQDLRIGAGDKEFISADTFAVPVPSTVMAIQAHSHYRARDVLLSAELPDGSVRTLLHINDWDFNWQDHYRLAQPIRLPAGSTLRSRFKFDNSNDNPRNPNVPAQDVQWGWRTSDEMADVWVQVVTDTTEDQKRLSLLARHKSTAEDAIGAEILIAREPRHFNLRNDAALIYQELQQPQKALQHFEAARRIRPELPSAVYNVGTALESLGRREEAVVAYRDALRLAPSYSRAHVRLGTLLYRQGQLEEALTEFSGALKLGPDNYAVRCERARILVQANRPLEARAEYLRALEVAPTSVACLINATWLFAAHQDSDIRSPHEAVRLGQLAVLHSGGSEIESAALDALAAAFATAGRFDDAVATGDQAQRLAQEPQRQEILDRLSLYRRRLPFRAVSDRLK